MLRLKPTAIFVTMAEVKELETRCRFLKYLELEDVYTRRNSLRARELGLASIQVDSALISPDRGSISPANGDRRHVSSPSNVQVPLSVARLSSQPVIERRTEEAVLPGPDLPRRRNVRGFANSESGARDQQTRSLDARRRSVTPSHNPPTGRLVNTTDRTAQSPPSPDIERASSQDSSPQGVDVRPGSAAERVNQQRATASYQSPRTAPANSVSIDQVG